jgi:hypothetical protein
MVSHTVLFKATTFLNLPFVTTPYMSLLVLQPNPAPVRLLLVNILGVHYPISWKNLSVSTSTLTVKSCRATCLNRPMGDPVG